MDFITVGSSLGLLSSIIHAGQGAFQLMRHFKITSTCCNMASSLEIDVTGSPVIHENNSAAKS